MENKLNIKYIPVKDLIPSVYNPRKWNEKAISDLTESIKKYGLVDAILVNSAENRKNIIIGGHFRLKIAKDLGYKEVPCVYINIPDIEREKELNIRLNKNLGEFVLICLPNLTKTSFPLSDFRAKTWTKSLI